MRTPLRIVGAVVTVAVAVAVAVFVVPGMAAGGEGPRPAVGPTEPAPAVTDAAVAIDLPAPTEPAPAAPAGSAPVAEPVQDPVPVRTVKPRSPTGSSPPSDPNGTVSSPVLPIDPGYWTPERMAGAKPMPMPTPGDR